MTLLWEYSVGDEAEQLSRIEITWPKEDDEPWLDHDRPAVINELSGEDRKMFRAILKHFEAGAMQ